MMVRDGRAWCVRCAIAHPLFEAQERKIQVFKPNFWVLRVLFALRFVQLPSPLVVLWSRTSHSRGFTVFNFISQKWGLKLLHARIFFRSYLAAFQKRKKQLLSWGLIIFLFVQSSWCKQRWMAKSRVFKIGWLKSIIQISTYHSKLLNSAI